MPSVIWSFFSACLLVGRHEVKENCGGLGAAVRILAILLALQSIEWRWPGSRPLLPCSAGWLLFSCLSPNANMNWGISASHPPKASSCCSHPMHFHTVLTKNDAAANQNDGILGPIWPWFPPSSSWPPLPDLPISRSSWSPPFSQVTIILGFFFPVPPWAAGAPILPGFIPFFSMLT